ncbi:MAG TPA: ABC transporter ATP-binding protein [Clostridiaceae bacterium]|jgi:ABC-2 type transport system ATP-binding protein|nr:ABC transporter ATP-binding protein [Clostridiaceae bacterium]
MERVVLTVSNLSKNYGEIKAVDDVSFEIHKSEIMGLVGPNGAGKSTVIRIIMGILASSGGKVEFPLNGKSASLDKERVGYLPEERGLYNDVKVLDNLIYLAELKGISRKEAKYRAMKWLERLDLADYANKKLEKLSKGMQQKVQFIGAILHKPDLVVLDEPFSGLDPLNQEIFKEIIQQLGKDGTTVLLSAHQMNVVEELCDSVFMIHKGKQVLYGNLREIKKEYKEYIINISYQEGEDISFLKDNTDLLVLKEQPQYISFRYSGDATVNNLIQNIMSKLKVEEIRAEKPPLHDIFIQIVKERGEEIEEYKAM